LVLEEVMTQREIDEKISRDEINGEKLISIFRVMLSVIYIASLPIISVVRNAEGFGYLPWRAHIGTTIFLLYSLFIFFYMRRKEMFHRSLKYVLVVIDMTIISIIIWITNTYPENCLPIIYLSIQAQFYTMLILIGSFRYSVSCAFFSGIYAGICYLIVVIVSGNALDLPYSAEFNSEIFNLRFPLYNESFRVLGMMFTGVVSGIASRRLLKLFNSLLELQVAATESVSKTMDKTRSMAKTIQKSTDEIFLSSKNIFSTANNQAASVQEIESTIKENANITEDVVDKTSSVANIVINMENNVISGFSVLERNVKQLDKIKNKNEGVINGIIALGNKINRISDIVQNIHTITDQTKVIAFNAALEAASAGDRGKRFSVVASEVNRLADSIAGLTKQIRTQVEEIQNSSSSLIISSEESTDNIIEGNNLIKELENIFREIRSGAEITANQAQTISASTEKQLKSSEQIYIAISDISKGLTNFIQSTKVATSSAEELSNIIKELDAILTH
jgi:methyl-accepting chemotaxis protein